MNNILQCTRQTAEFKTLSQKQNKKLTRANLAQIIGVSPDAIKQHLSKLQNDKLLKRVGGRKDGYWIILVKDVYKISVKFPKEEIYGLTSQIKRATISILSNILEDASRQSNKEFIQFLYIALGSASEVEAQLIIAKEFNFIDSKDLVLTNGDIIK